MPHETHTYGTVETKIDARCNQRFQQTADFSSTLLCDLWGKRKGKMVYDSNLEPQDPPDSKPADYVDFGGSSGDDKSANHGCEPDDEPPADENGEEEAERTPADGPDADADVLDDPTFLRIHFRELPKDSVSREHVISLLGPEKSKENSTVEDRLSLIERRQADVRAWAREHIKKRIVGNARKLGFRLNGDKPGEGEVRTFADLKLWWRTRERKDQQAADDLGYVLYGWFDQNKKWERKLERKFMAECKWAYTAESVDEANKNAKKTGVVLKGCVALTMTYMKVEAVRQMQRVGKKSRHGLVITKSRPGGKSYNDRGKYVKRKEGQYFLQYHSASKKKTTKVRFLLLMSTYEFIESLVEWTNRLACQVAHYTDKVVSVETSWSGRYKNNERRRKFGNRRRGRRGRQRLLPKR